MNQLFSKKYYYWLRIFTFTKSKYKINHQNVFVVLRCVKNFLQIPKGNFIDSYPYEIELIT